MAPKTVKAALGPNGPEKTPDCFFLKQLGVFEKQLRVFGKQLGVLFLNKCFSISLNSPQITRINTDYHRSFGLIRIYS